MKIKDLEGLGGFAEQGTQRKEVTWKNPKTGEEHTFDIFVKSRTIAMFEKYMLSFREPDVSFCAMQISQCVVMEGGEQFTYEEAAALAPSLARVLNQAVTDVLKAEEAEAETKN